MLKTKCLMFCLFCHCSALPVHLSHGRFGMLDGYHFLYFHGQSLKTTEHFHPPLNSFFRDLPRFFFLDRSVQSHIFLSFLSTFQYYQPPPPGYLYI